MVTADGYFKGMHEDISWHKVDAEVNEYITDQLRTADTLLFGRKTYTVMEDFWPREEAFKEDPAVAEMMARYLKIVISTTLEKTNWNNTRLINRNVPEEVQKLKQEPGKNLFIFGSAALSELLMHHHLIDEFRLMVNPVTLGAGISLFKNTPMDLQLLKAKVFGNGNILLCYFPK